MIFKGKRLPTVLGVFSIIGADNALSIGSGIVISDGVAILVCCGPP